MVLDADKRQLAHPPREDRNGFVPRASVFAYNRANILRFTPRRPNKNHRRYKGTRVPMGEKHDWRTYGHSGNKLRLSRFFIRFFALFLKLSRYKTIDFTLFYEIVRDAAISPWDILLCILLKMRTSWISPCDTLLHFLIVIWKHFGERQISA